MKTYFPFVNYLFPAFLAITLCAFPAYDGWHAYDPINNLDHQEFIKILHGPVLPAALHEL